MTSLAPTVSLLISALLPWLSSAGSAQQHTTDPFSHPDPQPPPATPAPSTAVPSPVPGVHPAAADSDDDDFDTDAGDNGLPDEDQHYGSGSVPHVHRVSSEFPLSSPHGRFKSKDPGGTYTHFISHMGFEFGPDWIVVPSGCTLDIEIKRPWCFDAFDSSDTHLFSIKSGSNLAISMRNTGMRKLGKTIELSAGTYRVGDVSHPDHAMLYSKAVIPP